MSQRHKDAVAIADGACNPLAIANSICRALNEIRENPEGWSTHEMTDDPAVKLMASQLAYLTQVCGVACRTSPAVPTSASATTPASP